MLPQPILVSTNAIEGINPQVTYFDDKVDADGIYRGVEFGTNKPIYNIILGINENRRVVKKIIAGIPELPSIDFSVLSEEDCKKIRWVDVEKLARDFAGIKHNRPLDDEERYYNSLECMKYDLFKEGFKTAQSLNEKKFSEEDIRKAIEMAREIIDGKEVFEIEGILGLTEVCTHNCSVHSVDKIIQSLSQPKVFDVIANLSDDNKSYIITKII